MRVWYFFPRELSFGRGSTAPVGGGSFPNITPREPWDGKDGEVSGFEGLSPQFVHLWQPSPHQAPPVLPGALSACVLPFL